MNLSLTNKALFAIEVARQVVLEVCEGDYWFSATLKPYKGLFVINVRLAHRQETFQVILKEMLRTENVGHDQCHVSAEYVEDSRVTAIDNRLNHGMTYRYMACRKKMQINLMKLETR